MVYDRAFSEEYKEIISILLEAVHEGDSVIDMGCGTGLVSFPLAKKCRRVVGMDSSSAMIAVANTRKDALDETNAEFLVSEAGHAVSGFSKDFDVVLFCNVLHVVADPRAVLEAAKGYLADGGRLLVVSYCHGERLRFRARVMSLGMRVLHTMGKIPHIHLLSFSDVTDLCRVSGFEVVDTRLFETGGFPCAFVVARPE